MWFEISDPENLTLLESGDRALIDMENEVIVWASGEDWSWDYFELPDIDQWNDPAAFKDALCDQIGNDFYDTGPVNLIKEYMEDEGIKLNPYPLTKKTLDEIADLFAGKWGICNLNMKPFVITRVALVTHATRGAIRVHKVRGKYKDDQGALIITQCKKAIDKDRAIFLDELGNRTLCKFCEGKQ